MKSLILLNNEVFKFIFIVLSKKRYRIIYVINKKIYTKLSINLIKNNKPRSVSIDTFIISKECPYLYLKAIVMCDKMSVNNKVISKVLGTFRA